jgi:uncharacterized membrane protein
MIYFGIRFTVLQGDAWASLNLKPLLMLLQQSPFLDGFHFAMLIGAIGFFALGIGLYIMYQVRVSMITDYKEKHDFISVNEIPWLKRVFLCFSVALAMLINIFGQGRANLNEVGVWFFVRMIMGIAGGTLLGTVSFLVLQYWYPTRLNSRLQKWRYMPRVNPKTGNKMKLLTEEEEDVHLDLGMQAEENIFSIDYDVWVDDASGDVKIEKYLGHLTGLRCNNCGFYTMKVWREEIIERHEDGTPKELLKHYQCAYCKNVRATQFHVSQREIEDYKTIKMKFQRNTKGIEAIKIEVHSSLAGKKNFEFQSIEQAQKFLEEFDIDKIAD